MKMYIETFISMIFSVFPAFLIFFKNVPDSLQIKIVMNNPYTLRYLWKQPCFEAQKIAVFHDCSLVKYVKNPSEPLQWYLLEVDPTRQSFRFINNVCEDIQNKLFDESESNIKFILNQTRDIQFKAISRCLSNIVFINYPCAEVQYKMIDTKPDWIVFIPEQERSEQASILSLQFDGEFIRFFRKPTERLCFTALENNPKSFLHISEPTEHMALYALENCWREFLYKDVENKIINPSETFRKELHKLKLKYGALQ